MSAPGVSGPDKAAPRASRSFPGVVICLIALFFTLHGAAAQENGTVPVSATTMEPPPIGPPKFSMIVVLKDLRSLLQLKAMCARHPWSWKFSFRRFGLPSDCHMPGICRRIYSTALFGFAGEFSDQEMARVQRCLPGAVYYRELDGKVYKQEDASMMRWATTSSEALLGRRLQQSQQGAPLESSNDAASQSPSPEANATSTNDAAADSTLSDQSTNDPDLPVNTGTVRSRPVTGAGDVDTDGDIKQLHSFEVINKTRDGGDQPLDVASVLGSAGPEGFASPGRKTQLLPDAGTLWHLDRIEKRELPLNKEYSYGDAETTGTGKGVTIYVIDSGIIKNHQEFQYGDGSSGSRASYGFDFVDDDEEPDDCDGHGTHVSATAAGLQVGVAKNAKIVSVRILDCAGSGTISDTVAALDWVAANAENPAIAILSLGIQVGSWSRVLEEATRSLVRNHGITVVVASGNSAVDACYVAPANVPEVITVAASDVGTKYGQTEAGDTEAMYKWSNTGPCVDLFAPGVDIYSACGSQSRCEQVSPDAYTYASGTSMAVPSVAGVAALYLEAHPDATPSDVSAALLAASTSGKVETSSFKQGTSNRLLYSWVNGAEKPAGRSVGDASNSTGGPQSLWSVVATNGP